MKKLGIIFLFFILSGCKTVVPITQSFPTVPEELMVPCPNLDLVNENEKELSNVLDVVVGNYGKYQECKFKIDMWIKWYTIEKGIFSYK
jgi:hypothetical protein